jgi:hypothetical protein
VIKLTIPRKRHWHDIIFLCNLRINECEVTLRVFSLIFVLLFPNSEVLTVVSLISGYCEFITSIVLKLHFFAAGILQLIFLLYADSYSVSNFLGIDSEAIWKIRIVNNGVAFIGYFILLYNQIKPMFYFRMLRSAIPADSWIISICSTSLVSVTLDLLILVQICKNYNNWKIVHQVSSNSLASFIYINISRFCNHTYQ